MKNTQLKIKDLCPNEYIEIIEFYWKLNENPLEFENTPKKVRTKYELEQSEVNKIIQPYSMLSFYLHCKNCNSFELNEASSQSTFKQKLKKYRDPGFKCQNCIKLEKEEEQKRREIKKAELISKLDKAVDEKRWENLKAFDYKLLDHCISKNFKELKQHYGPILGRDNFKRLFHGLYTLAELDLIVLETEMYNNRVTDVQVYDRLRENFEYVPPVKKKPITTKTKINNINALKFTLPVDKKKRHPDDPTFAGTTVFSERIILEPGIEYSFALWERANENLYLVIVPTEDIYPSPKVTPLSRKPISVQEGIRNFFDSIKPDSTDW